MSRKKRTITDEEKQMFLSLKPDDITMEKFNELFSDKLDTSNGKQTIVSSPFNTFDEFDLKAGEYFNKEKVRTNCGLFIFNKFLIEPHFQNEVGYVNFVVTNKTLGKIDSKIAAAIMLDESPNNQITRYYIEYLNRLSWMAFALNTQICSSLSMKTVKPLPKIMARKKQLIKENEQAIKDNDVITYKEIENELVKLAEQELKDDPSYELYSSGARGAFDNAYRQWLCTKGPIWNASKGEFELVTNSLYEGVPKDKLPAMANAIVSGFYPKSIGTGESGYVTKQLAAAFQSVVLDDKGTDCGTLHCADIELTDDNIKYYLYHFIKKGSNYIRLEPNNQSKFVNTRVKMRLPDYCCGSKICNRCAGDRFYLMGIDKVGITFGRVSNSLMRAKFKKSHDSTVRTYRVDPNDIFV